MYGCSRAPSLLRRYATKFVFHKEVLKKVFLNGVSIFLHDTKKATFPPLSFYIGGYKFSKVKGAEYFVKDLETFHFGQKSFQINDSRGNFVEHRVEVKINYEYIDFFSKYEEAFRRANNFIELKKHFGRKSGASGRKDGSTTMETKL